jgi:hypothetical protein
MQTNKNGISIQLLEDVKRGLERLTVKKLSAGTLVDYLGSCCALGAAVIHRATRGSTKPISPEQFPKIMKETIRSGFDIYRESGARGIYKENDLTEDMESDFQRYTRMYKWVCEELKNK